MSDNRHKESLCSFQPKRTGFAAVALLQAAAWVDPAPHRIQFVTVFDDVRVELRDFLTREADVIREVVEFLACSLDGL
jgi:hypothetical protein